MVPLDQFGRMYLLVLFSVIESLDFPCDQCERSFASRAGVSRHKLLKHNPNGETRHIGPWSDPALAALRRRNRLKEVGPYLVLTKSADRSFFT